jgi:polyhydroxyalkanoate synthesis regulator phasin
MADEPENLVLVLLREIRSDIAALDTKVNSLEAKVDRKFDQVNDKVDSVIKQLIDVQHDVSMLRHAIAPGEMEAANRDIADLKRRVEALEERNKNRH